MALRRHDLRRAQRQLAALGLSSLGRAESHVMQNLEAVLAVLNRLAGTGARASRGYTKPSRGKKWEG